MTVRNHNRRQFAFLVLPFALVLSVVSGYHVVGQHKRTAVGRRTTAAAAVRPLTFLRMEHHNRNDDDDDDDCTVVIGYTNDVPKRSSSSHNPLLLASVTLCSLLALGSVHAPAAVAYSSSDYASETVTGVIESLKAAKGNVADTFKAYEDIQAIITEGKGVGGSVNYQGIQLERGYIADEDTTIYNPGLTLLTESEKERLVEAVMTSRKDGLSTGQWSEDNELGSQYLKDKLDPLHVTELRGYLQVVPFLSAAVYLAVLAVQQLARDSFPAAYFLGVGVVVLPAVGLILAAGV
jgi:hypothetical protein